MNKLYLMVALSASASADSYSLGDCFNILEFGQTDQDCGGYDSCVQNYKDSQFYGYSISGEYTCYSFESTEAFFMCYYSTYNCEDNQECKSFFYKCADSVDADGNLNEVDCIYGICDGSSYCTEDDAYNAY